MATPRYLSAQDKQNQVFLDFLKGRKVIVADPSSLIRSSVGKILTSLGISAKDLVLVAQFSEAVEQVVKIKPGLFICEYEFAPGEFGVDIFQKLVAATRELTLNQRPITMILTGNMTEIAVARGARSDADLYIFKPFVPETLREKILKLAASRNEPNEYLTLIHATRQKVAEGKLDQAIKVLDLAKTKYMPGVESPFLVKPATRLPVDPGVMDRRGHFQCLMDIYDLLQKQKRSKEAYAVLKLVHPFQPLDQLKLIEVIQLVIKTQNFADLGHFFKMYSETPSKSDELLRNMHAALIVAGKVLAKLGDKTESELCFARAVKVSVGKEKLLRQTIESMVEAGVVTLASESLSAYHPTERSKTDYIALDFYIRDKKGEGDELLFKGWKLLDEGHRDPLIYKVMIRRLVALKKVDPAENLANDGIRRWPHLKEVFSVLSKKQEIN